MNKMHRILFFNIINVIYLINVVYKYVNNSEYKKYLNFNIL